MCLIDTVDETCQVLDATWRRARKPHRCHECCRDIEPGEQYHHESLLYDGTISTHKTCRHCMRVRQWLFKRCGGWVYEGLLEDLDYHDHHVRARIWSVGMRRRWTRRDGSQWRLP